MNYGLVSAAVLFASLIFTFIRYEQKNVSVKDIALTATLAGLAGISRVLFAAIPNVQPTTFIVIISGYVFGPGFGFMVGATAALVSNSFLGHGPWTPWQMLAWGLAGLSAGVFKKLAGERPSRLGISVFAFCWGFLFDFIMNLWHWLFFIYPLTVKSFTAVFAASFYFDLMHSAGNFVFAYLFGADLINILSRFKSRIGYTEIPLKKTK